MCTGALDIFSLPLLSKTKFFSMTLCDVDLAVAALEVDEARESGNVLTCLRSVVETLKQHDQVNFSCVSSYEKLISFIFHN